MSNIDEITRILHAAELLFSDAAARVADNPALAVEQIANGINTMHSIRGFLL